MLLTLLWLTVSIPFIYKAQQAIAKEKITAAHSQSANDDESAANPLTNTNEEKSSTNVNSLSEEYLHHHALEEINHSAEAIARLHHANEATYVAFHGELLCPPPNA